MGALGFTNPRQTAASEYAASVKITAPLVEQIVSKAHQPPDDDAIRTIYSKVLLKRRMKDYVGS